MTIFWRRLTHPARVAKRSCGITGVLDSVESYCWKGSKPSYQLCPEANYSSLSSRLWKRLCFCEAEGGTETGRFSQPRDEAIKPLVGTQCPLTQKL